jgi:microcystin degradation protein MlrC
MDPRIALLGFMLESNAFSPVADEAEFRQKHWLEGEEIVQDARSARQRDPGGFVGFCRAMDESGPWEPVPLAMTTAGASGPVEQGFFDRFVRLIEERLRAAMPLDGVYIQAHGACRGTVDLDPEGTLFAVVRAIVGPKVPVVATLDLHANVSRKMVEETDLLIAYLTNPHTDHADRGAEAGRAMRELLAGMRTAKAFVKLPILPPQVALLSDRGPTARRSRKGRPGSAVRSWHFRAGFDDIFSDAQILEVDGPGLATPVLTRVKWTGLMRPIWPLDPDRTWRVPDEVAVS